MKWINCTLIGGIIGVATGTVYKAIQKHGDILEKPANFFSNEVTVGGSLGAMFVNGVSLASDLYDIYTDKKRHVVSRSILKVVRAQNISAMFNPSTL